MRAKTIRCIAASKTRLMAGEFWATQYHPEFTLYEMARLLVARKTPLTQEGFFGEEDEVEALVAKMISLSEAPENKELRQELNVNDDILNDNIRQTEVRNWLEFLVIPSMNQ
jgi:GMP synthase (glutamine-hydrolysing)